MSHWSSTISPGYDTIEQEFEASLRRAFVDGKADYIVLYSRRHKFRYESAAYGALQGWLDEEFIEVDEQSSELHYRLTEDGKKHFGL